MGFAQYGEQADAEITKIIEQNEMESPAKTAKAAATKVAMGN